MVTQRYPKGAPGHPAGGDVSKELPLRSSDACAGLFSALSDAGMVGGRTEADATWGRRGLHQLTDGLTHNLELVVEAGLQGIELPGERLVQCGRRAPLDERADDLDARGNGNRGRR